MGREDYDELVEYEDYEDEPEYEDRPDEFIDRLEETEEMLAKEMEAQIEDLKFGKISIAH